jgi:hypothetical protein
MDRAPALAIGGPALRQVEPTVDEGVPMLGDISGEHADLAVGDLAGRAGVLAGNAAGGLALLEEPGLVDDEHRVGRAQYRDDIVAHQVAQRIGIPDGAAKHGLLPPGTWITGSFGPHPAGLTPFRPEEPVDVRGG